MVGTAGNAPTSSQTTAGRVGPAFGIAARDYLRELERLCAELDVGALERITAEVRRARDAGAAIYVAGNGGSAATAMHWVNDINKAASRSGRRRIRAMCLSDNTSWLTALANDEGYERVFAAQLESFARPGDLLVLISASGNSPNLLAAALAARDRGVRTAAVLGFDGGRLHGMVDEALLVSTPPGWYGLVETMHVVALDIVTTFLISDRAPGG